MAGISIRPLSVRELDRVNEIDVSETGSTFYKQAGRQVALAYEEWHRPRRSREVWDRYVAQWRPMLAHGGSAIGAFSGEALVGIAVLRLQLSESMAQLAALFVSKDHRRLHVAQRLTDEVVRLAQQSGAKALYVSATPSESAFGFYTSQGFEPTEQVNEELYSMEPEDIHMVKPLWTGYKEQRTSG